MSNGVKIREQVVVFNELVKKLINDGLEFEEAKLNAKALKKWRYHVR